LITLLIVVVFSFHDFICFGVLVEVVDFYHGFFVFLLAFLDFLHVQIKQPHDFHVDPVFDFEVPVERDVLAHHVFVVDVVVQFDSSGGFPFLLINLFLFILLNYLPFLDFFVCRLGVDVCGLFRLFGLFRFGGAGPGLTAPLAPRKLLLLLVLCDDLDVLRVEVLGHAVVVFEQNAPLVFQLGRLFDAESLFDVAQDVHAVFVRL